MEKEKNKKETLNICLECENDWEQDDATYCPYCLSGDFVREEGDDKNG